MKKHPLKSQRNILLDNDLNNPSTSNPPNTPNSAEFYAENPRALLAKRMVADLIEMVKTRKTTKYIPKYPERICHCDKEKYSWTCSCTPGKAPCMCGLSIAVEEAIPNAVLKKYRAEIRECFFTAYRLDKKFVDNASSMTEGELITLWCHARCSKRFWKLRTKANRRVAIDWISFRKIERTSMSH